MVTFDQSLDYPVEGETIEEIALEYDLDVNEIRDKISVAGGEETYTSSISAIGNILEENPDYVCISPTGSPTSGSWSAWIGDSYGALEEGGANDEQHLDAVRVAFNHQAEKLDISYDRDVVLLWTQPMRSLEHAGLNRNEARAYLRDEAGESLSAIADELEMNPEEVQNLMEGIRTQMDEARRKLENMDANELQAMIAMSPTVNESTEETARRFDKDFDEVLSIEMNRLDRSSDEGLYPALLLLTKGRESYSEVYEIASRSSGS